MSHTGITNGGSGHLTDPFKTYKSSTPKREAWLTSSHNLPRFDQLLYMIFFSIKAYSVCHTYKVGK